MHAQSCKIQWANIWSWLDESSIILEGSACGYRTSITVMHDFTHFISTGTKTWGCFCYAIEMLLLKKYQTHWLEEMLLPTSEAGKECVKRSHADSNQASTVCGKISASVVSPYFAKVKACTKKQTIFSVYLFSDQFVAFQLLPLECKMRDKCASLSLNGLLYQLWIKWPRIS